MATYRVATNGPRFCAANLRVRGLTLQPGCEVELELDEQDLEALAALAGESSPVAGVYLVSAQPEPEVVAADPEPPKPRRRARTAEE